jgi:hypothetical protein
MKLRHTRPRSVDLLVAYLQERQTMLDHTNLAGLAGAVGGLFWRDLERHYPGTTRCT